VAAALRGKAVNDAQATRASKRLAISGGAAIIFAMSDRSDFDLTPILPWASGGMFALIGFFALLIASRAGGAMTYWIGLGIFVASVLAIFYLIAKSSDHSS